MKLVFRSDAHSRREEEGKRALEIDEERGRRGSGGILDNFKEKVSSRIHPFFLFLPIYLNPSHIQTQYCPRLPDRGAEDRQARLEREEGQEVKQHDKERKREGRRVGGLGPGPESWRLLV